MKLGEIFLLMRLLEAEMHRSSWVRWRPLALVYVPVTFFLVQPSLALFTPSAELAVVPSKHQSAQTVCIHLPSVEIHLVSLRVVIATRAPIFFNFR